MGKVTITLPKGGIIDIDNPDVRNALGRALKDIGPQPVARKMSLDEINENIAIYEDRIRLLKVRKANFWDK